VKTIKGLIAVAAALILVAGIGWFELQQYRCRQRNATFSGRIRTVEQDAREQLKVGTRREAVARFYKAHEIPFEVVWLVDTNEAIGTLYTVGGCAPLGCGTDNVLIGVRVKLDADGTLTGEPEVVDMYADCL
jgi:hypothetical protein